MQMKGTFRESGFHPEKSTNICKTRWRIRAPCKMEITRCCFGSLFFDGKPRNVNRARCRLNLLSGLGRQFTQQVRANLLPPRTLESSERGRVSTAGGAALLFLPLPHARNRFVATWTAPSLILLSSHEGDLSRSIENVIQGKTHLWRAVALGHLS